MKPNPMLCPQRFCFHWREAGTKEASGLYPDLEQALDAAQPVTESGCGYPFGECVRLRGRPDAPDGYEPNEPELEQAGLPWFYFIASREEVADEMREQYIRESEALWGPRHWLV
jgi:hypothetical protein